MKVPDDDDLIFNFRLNARLPRNRVSKQKTICLYIAGLLLVTLFGALVYLAFNLLNPYKNEKAPPVVEGLSNEVLYRN